MSDEKTGSSSKIWKSGALRPIRRDDAQARENFDCSEGDDDVEVISDASAAVRSSALGNGNDSKFSPSELTRARGATGTSRNVAPFLGDEVGIATGRVPSHSSTGSSMRNSVNREEFRVSVKSGAQPKKPRPRPSFGEWTPSSPKRNKSTSIGEVTEVIDIMTGSPPIPSTSRPSVRLPVSSGRSRKIERQPNSTRASTAFTGLLSSEGNLKAEDANSPSGEPSSEVVCIDDEEKVSCAEGKNSAAHGTCRASISPPKPRRKSARISNQQQTMKNVDLDVRGALKRSRTQIDKPGISESIHLDDEQKFDESSEEDNDEPSPDDARADSPDVRKPSDVRGNALTESLAEPTVVLLKFPPSERGKIAITSEDLRRLQDHQYLNDSLIDFYCKYLELDRKRKLTSFKAKHSVFFFNSFFFHRLRQTIPLDYEGVKRWTNSVDLFQTSFIFVPMCVTSHWSLIVVANIHKLRGLIDLDLDDAVYAAKELGQHRPKIVYMDSLEPKRGQAFSKTMIEYLAHEWINRCLDRHVEDEAKRKKRAQRLYEKLLQVIKIVKPPVPVQSNETDCGLYVLHNIECFLDESNGFRDELLEQELHVKRIRGWYTHFDIHKLRDKIVLLITQMTCSLKGKDGDTSVQQEIRKEMRSRTPDKQEEDRIPKDTRSCSPDKHEEDSVLAEESTGDRIFELDDEAQQLSAAAIAVCVGLGVNKAQDDEDSNLEPLEDSGPPNDLDLETCRNASSEDRSAGGERLSSPDKPRHEATMQMDSPQMDSPPIEEIAIDVDRVDEKDSSDTLEEDAAPLPCLSSIRHPSLGALPSAAEAEPMDESQEMDLDSTPASAVCMEISTDTYGATDDNMVL